jgi:predicted ATP-grasp superfamily ATP-dependent carboligase
MDHQKPSITCDVLILNAESRAALAAIRSLGRAGLRVAAASHSAKAIGLASRYCFEKLICPNPTRQIKEFEQWLVETTQTLTPPLLIPCSDLAVEIVSDIREHLPTECCIPIGSNEQVKRILSKNRLLAFARSLGISCPTTILIPAKGARSGSEEIASLSFPCVLKSDVSYSEDTKGNFDKHPVYYPESLEELRALINRIDTPLLVQERISGVGVGVFALCMEGQTKCLFAHERLLEKPPSGGRSVLSKAIPLGAAPTEQATMLLRELQWSGPAMVEFKRDEQGRFHLMEVNPRFWGTLQLAISSGIDFPLATHQLFVDQKEFTLQESYKAGLRLRWLLGTCDHMFINLKRNPIASICNLIFKNSLKLFQGKTCYDVMQLDDSAAFRQELRNYFGPHD